MSADNAHQAAQQTPVRDSLVDFTARWRLEAAASGVPLCEDNDLQGLRDHSDRPAQVDWN
jgi:hypothetical protein